MQLLRDKNLLAFLSEGYLYICDLSSMKTQSGKIQCKLNIRIPNERINVFDIDFNMNTLLISTINGHLYVYDLPKALENERVLAKKKIQMGVEDDLVYTYLEPVNNLEGIEEFQKSRIGNAKALSDNNVSQASFIKGLVS